MYLNSPYAAKDFISPFGSTFHVPQGFKTHVPVEEGYWLSKIPDLEVTFESDAEFEECQRLLALAKLNPLKGIPKPQQVTPNATLQLDGYATKYPVVVVNPQGLLQYPVPEFHFGNPTVNLVFDKAMVRQVFEEFQAALSNPTLDYDDTPSYEVGAGPLPVEPELTVEGPVPPTPTEELTDAQLEELTNPETSNSEATTQPTDTAAPIEDGGSEFSPEAPGEDSTSEEAGTTPPDETEAPATESKGRGRTRRGGINDEDI